MELKIKHLSIAAALSSALLITSCAGTSANETEERELNIGVSADIVETIPSAIAQVNTRAIMNNMYDTLVVEPSSGTTPEPSIATDWEVSADRLAYSFQLRDDIMFHNGEEMTAEDVKWSLEYAMEDPNTESDLANIESVDTSDPYELSITLSTPQPDFLMALTDPSMSIIPKDFAGATADEFRESPVGTGPFTYAGRTVGTEISFEKFEEYWGETASVSGLNYSVFPDVNAEAIALTSGDIDIANNVPLDSVSLFEGEVVESTPQLVQILQINSNNELLMDEKLRHALSLGMDRSSIVENLMGGFGEPAATSLSATSFPEGVPEVDGRPYETDLELAQELVSDSTYDGTPLRLIYSTGIPTDISIAAALQAHWEEIGVAIELAPLESGEWLNAVTATPPHDEFDLSISRASGATATPQFGFMMASNYFGGGWPTDDVEHAMSNYATAEDESQQQQALVEFENQLGETLKTVPIAHMSNVTVSSGEISGLPSDGPQYMTFNSVTIE